MKTNEYGYVIFVHKGVSYKGEDYPCAKCGLNAARSWEDLSKNGYRIRCKNCGNEGPTGESRLKALAEWEIQSTPKTSFEKRVSDGEDPHMILLEMILDIEARLG